MRFNHTPINDKSSLFVLSLLQRSLFELSWYLVEMWVLWAYIISRINATRTTNSKGRWIYYFRFLRENVLTWMESWQKHWIGVITLHIFKLSCMLLRWLLLANCHILFNRSEIWSSFQLRKQAFLKRCSLLRNFSDISSRMLNIRAKYIITEPIALLLWKRL